MIDEYLQYQINAEKKYGKNTIVFYENGTFYELYGVDNEKEKVGQPKRISEILNIAITRKNKKILENSRKNPLLVGVPTAHSEKHIKTLINNGFTIVFVEQTSIPPNPDRALTKVLSPSTYIADEYKSDNNYILAMFFETSGQKSLGVGMCAYDLTTGDGIFYQTIVNDYEVVLEEVYRFMEAIDPKEIVINIQYCENLPFNDIKEHLELYRHQFYIRDLKPDYFKLSYQNKILQKVFPNESMLSAIEYLNMEFQQLSLLSLMLCLDFIYDHDDRILRSLNTPREWEEKKHLILNNNTLYQLNVVCDGSIGNAKSLFDIINCTKTIMGKRALKNWMLNPIVSHSVLERKYDTLQKIIDKELWKKYDKLLSMVIDLERFFRKMTIGYLLPHEMASFESSIDAIKTIIELSREDFTEEENNFIDVFVVSEVDRFLEFYYRYYDTFNLGIMATFCLNNINQSFFKIGIIPELDTIQERIISDMTFFENEAKKLSKLLDLDDSVKVDHNERDGYFLKTTTTRGKNLAKKITSNYEMKSSGANICRIMSKELEDTNKRLEKYEIDIGDKVRDCFIKWCENTYQEFHQVFTSIVRFISTIDMSISMGKISRDNSYKRPQIQIKKNSFLKAKGLRHPIIEKINLDTLYIPNDVEIDSTGILLYGLNGGGKSSLLKAVGLATIMAQMGLFVPAEEFIYYPFKTLYTRIMGNDNIFRGLSSFALEMTELRTILQYANERSLILGDEICRGTEIHSALSIVSSAVHILCEKKTNFLFATHLHKLHEIDVVKDCKNLRHFYIDLTFENGKLIFGRKIYEGIGRKLYGLEVAEHIVENDEFLNLAKKVRRQLLNIDETEIISTKKSSYNSDVYVDKCEICSRINSTVSKKEISCEKETEGEFLRMGCRLEVHHVNSQKFADCNDTIDFYHKNHKGNLVVLCPEHHLKVHQGEIEIEGWMNTVNGVELIWRNKEKTKKTKKRIVKDDTPETSENTDSSYKSEKLSSPKTPSTVELLSGKSESPKNPETKVHIIEKGSKELDEETIKAIKKYSYLSKNWSLRNIKLKIEKDLDIKITIQQLKKILDNVEYKNA